MPSVNTVPVTDRHNRPSVLSRVLLRTFFIDEGEARSPFAIRSVHIFRETDHLAPNTLLGDDGLLDTDALGREALMVFGPGNSDGRTEVDDGFDETHYTGIVGDIPDLCPNPEDPNNDCEPDFSNVGTSGIYQFGAVGGVGGSPGEFCVVLDGKNAGKVSGVDVFSVEDTGLIVQNTASATTKYVDVWTVKYSEGSEWTTVFNNFELFSDTFITLTQPLLFQAKNKLFNKHVKLGSRIDVKVGTEITIQNKDIDVDIKNTLKGSGITNTSIKIKKHNEDNNLPSRVKVIDTSAVDITSDNTIVFNWNTKNINPMAPQAKDDLGARTGTYSVQVEYDFFKEHIVSPLFYLIIN